MTQTFNALTHLEHLTAGRQVWIWGAGNQGRGICQTLSSHGVHVAGFIDKSGHPGHPPLMGLPVMGPETLSAADFATRSFIIIAAFFFEQEIGRDCEVAGLVAGRDFIPYSALKPNDYSIDVAGTCNLKCIACPRAARSPAERKLGFMPLAVYKKVLDKILEESPLVGNIQLYQWGEPALHPELPEMIEYAHGKGVRCAISSNLNANVDYERILSARPEWLRISASGWGENYEVTHTKGRWPVFLSNLRKIVPMARSFYPEIKIELYYHLYKHSVGEDLEKFQAIAAELGIELHPVYAYLISLDDVLGHCEGKSLPEHARQAAELLLLDLDKGIHNARQYAHLPCDALRCININWDASVSTCMMYYYPENNVITANYLEMPLQAIQSRRYASDLCKRCMGHGIHQYCGAYARLDAETIRAD